jgi:hypothetical protein
VPSHCCHHIAVDDMKHERINGNQIASRRRKKGRKIISALELDLKMLL